MIYFSIANLSSKHFICFLIFTQFQVLSASGGQIIAVQNPALSLSGAFSAAASSVGRGSPPTTVQSSSASAGLHMGMRGTPPRHHTSSPAAGTNLTFKQEPSSPPPIPISYASQPPHSRD